VSKRVLEVLKEKLSDAVVETSSFRGDDTAVVRPERLREVCLLLRDDPECAFDMPIDVTCVDYSTYGPGRPLGTRFVVVYHLRSTTKNHRVCLKVAVPDADPAVPSVVGVWKGVVWFEREVHDLFGVRFDGHPDPRRLLLYPEFVGHPLRKDYPLRGYQPIEPIATLAGDPVPGVTRKEG